MSVYAEHLSTCLQESYSKLQKQAGAWFSLREEVVLVKAMLCEELQENKRARLHLDGVFHDPREKLAAKAIYESTKDNVLRLIDKVADILVAAKKLEDNGDRSIPVGAVHAILSNTVNILDQEVTERFPIGVARDDFVMAVADKLRDNLLTVDQLASRTRLTPEVIDAEARAMHDSVPEFAASNGAA